MSKTVVVHKLAKPGFDDRMSSVCGLWEPKAVNRRWDKVTCRRCLAKRKS